MTDAYDLRLSISSGDAQHNKAPKSLHSKERRKASGAQIKKRSGLANTKQGTMESAFCVYAVHGCNVHKADVFTGQ